MFAPQSYNKHMRKNKKQNQNGFVPMLIIIALVVLVIVGFAFRHVLSAHK